MSQRQEAVPPPSVTEQILGRDRILVGLAMALISVIAWAYLVLLANDMAAGDMRLMGGAGPMKAGAGMAGMAMGQMAWSGLTFFAMFIMWWVMMVGMMIRP